MSERRRPHRSHVSYIDATRNYYAAAGYDAPYEWASHDDAPFASLTKPLAECRVGVVVTSYLPTVERTNFFTRPDAVFAEPHSSAARLENEALLWDHDETHTRDRESYLPLTRLAEAAAAGRIRDLSPRFYGVPTQYSHRTTQRRDAPEIEAFLRDDDVDVAVLVPL